MRLRLLRLLLRLLLPLRLRLLLRLLLRRWARAAAVELRVIPWGVESSLECEGVFLPSRHEHARERAAVEKVAVDGHELVTRSDISVDLRLTTRHEIDDSVALVKDDA
jgi:hypothetical protein